MFLVDREEANEQLDALKKGEIDELVVEKEHFLLFQPLLVQREDFKHFRGIAKHGGKIVYRYLEAPRS